jgi:beta-lactamase regulating signal transducer with metallopeptidase domain
VDVVLNWLGQGAVVALAAAALLHAIPRSRAQARYRFVWVACLVVMTLPAVPHLLNTVFPGQPAGHTPASLRPVVSMPTAWWTSSTPILGLWVLWCCACAARLVTAAVALRDVKRRSRECPPDIEARLPHWSRVRTTGRQARVMLSNGVRSAGVLGGGAPIIALAPALVEQLSDADLDRIVIHEWAHVQRHDDLGHIAQLIVGLLAGWHPAVWWLDRQLDFEREAACDELAIATTGSRKGYAACLVLLAGLPRGPGDSLAVLAAASSGLRRRIVRILASPNTGRASSCHALEIVATVAPVALSLIVGNVPIVQSAATSLNAVVTAPHVVLDRIASNSAAAFDRLRSPTLPARSVAGRRSQRSVGAPRISARQAESADADAPAMPLTPEPMPLAAEERPVLPVGATLDRPAFAPLGSPATPEGAVNAPIDAGATAPLGNSSPGNAEAQAPWALIANAGVAVGRGTQNAGVATAGFFSRFGKKIAASF